MDLTPTGIRRTLKPYHGLVTYMDIKFGESFLFATYVMRKNPTYDRPFVTGGVNEVWS